MYRRIRGACAKIYTSNRGDEAVRKMYFTISVLFILIFTTACSGEDIIFYDDERTPFIVEYLQAYEPYDPDYAECEFTETAEIAKPPDRTYIKKINNPNNIMTAQLDMWRVEGVAGTERWWDGYDAIISIRDANGRLIQEISLELSPISDFSFISIDPKNPFNFHFVDYNADGFLDMGIRVDSGGSMRNDPHLFWLWDDNANKFIRNHALEEWSNSASIIQVDDVGNIIGYARISTGHDFLVTAVFIDGELVTIQTQEYIAIFDSDDYHTKIITINNITGEETIEFLAWED